MGFLAQSTHSREWIVGAPKSLHHEKLIFEATSEHQRFGPHKDTENTHSPGFVQLLLSQKESEKGRRL